MNVAEILPRFKGVRRVGDGWIARCPAHEDHNPSLSIREENGRVLLHCHAGCSIERVLEAVGLKIANLFNNCCKPEIDTYDYCDELGTLLYQVVRYVPKDFRQRRPDGNGGWIPNLEGVRRVLYRLSEVLKAKCVLVAEGEKDCETAHNMGLVATRAERANGEQTTRNACAASALPSSRTQTSRAGNTRSKSPLHFSAEWNRSNCWNCLGRRT